MLKLTKYSIISLVIFSLVMTAGLVSAQDESITISEEAQQYIDLDENIQPADLGVSSPTILPDSPFYFFKNLGRNIQSFFTFDPVAKTELKEKFSNEKLIELKAMIERKKSTQAIQSAIENYEDEVKTVKTFAERIRATAQENEEVGKFLDKYTQHQVLHQTILQKLEEQVSEEVYAKILETREQHLEQFGEVMQKLEAKEKITERLEKNLKEIKGSDFKEFKNLELLESLKEKLPEEVQQKVEETKEAVLNTLRETLENLPEEKQKNFQEYVEKISGNEVKQLNILNALEGTELSEKLQAVVEQAREKQVQRIENRYENTITKQKAQDQIDKAAAALEKAKNLVIQKDTTNTEMPEVFRLIEQAEEQLTLAKRYFDEKNYTKAYAQATSALSLTQNAIRIIEIRAGFQSTVSTITELICTNADSPVCGKDNKTYRNICLAKKAGIEVSYRGECKTELACVKEGEKVNRNPLLGSTEQLCCAGLEEVRVSKSYSYCKQPGTSYECFEDADCPLSRCPGTVSKCVNNKCVIPTCAEPEVCIQVITPAKNPRTGECKEFPTPCDVPTGWEKVSACATNLKATWQQQIQLKLQSSEANQ